MIFEWDEAKRERVRLQRGIDFRDLALKLFDGRPVITKPSRRGDEERFLTIGMVQNRSFALIWVRRDEATRLITARRARDGEDREYRSVHGS
jgi:uncharacterized DUF497 family protein